MKLNISDEVEGVKCYKVEVANNLLLTPQEEINIPFFLYHFMGHTQGWRFEIYIVEQKKNTVPSFLKLKENQMKFTLRYLVGIFFFPFLDCKLYTRREILQKLFSI